jgi:hypothetical protein
MPGKKANKDVKKFQTKRQKINNKQTGNKKNFKNNSNNQNNHIFQSYDVINYLISLLRIYHIIFLFYPFNGKIFHPFVEEIKKNPFFSKKICKFSPLCIDILL